MLQWHLKYLADASSYSALFTGVNEIIKTGVTSPKLVCDNKNKVATIDFTPQFNYKG